MNYGLILQHRKYRHAGERRPSMRNVALSAILLLFCAQAYGQGFLETDLSQENHPLGKERKGKPQELLSPDQITKEKNFFFVIGLGGGQFGYDAIQITEDGRGLFVYATYVEKQKDGGMLKEQVWWRATFSLLPEEMVALRQCLSENRGLLSQDQYHVDNLADGTQVFVKLRVGAVTRTVYCNNHFPKTVQAIHEFFKNRLGDKLRTAMSAAKQITLEELRKSEYAQLRSPGWVSAPQEGKSPPEKKNN